MAESLVREGEPSIRYDVSTETQVLLPVTIVVKCGHGWIEEQKERATRESVHCPDCQEALFGEEA